MKTQPTSQRQAETGCEIIIPKPKRKPQTLFLFFILKAGKQSVFIGQLTLKTMITIPFSAVIHIGV